MLENEADAVIAQMQRLLSHFKSAKEQSEVSEEEKNKFSLDSRMSIVMLESLVSHRGPITPEQALELATLMNETRNLAEQFPGYKEPTLQELMVGAERLMNLQKPTSH